MEKKIKKRVEYIDLLRIIATLSVVFLHVAGQNWDTVNIRSFEWNVFNIYDSLVRWTVPVFVMISGALFLSKEYTLKELYLKKILRIITAFIFWSLIYTIVLKKYTNTIEFITSVLKGHFHMWFLFMIIGLYMLVPILKKISESKIYTRYYIILALAFSSILPLLASVLLEFNNKYTNIISDIIINDLGKLNLMFGYTGYFLLGYYIKENDFNKKQRLLIYVLGIIGCIFTIVLTKITSLNIGEAKTTYYGNLYFNITLQAVAIFVFAKFHFRTNAFIKQISKCCFGIYLVHIIFTNRLDELIGLNTLSFNPVISVPVISIIAFILSLIVSWIINKIPVINKYIV